MPIILIGVAVILLRIVVYKQIRKIKKLESLALCTENSIAKINLINRRKELIKKLGEHKIEWENGYSYDLETEEFGELGYETEEQYNHSVKILDAYYEGQRNCVNCISTRNIERQMLRMKREVRKSRSKKK